MNKIKWLVCEVNCSALLAIFLLVACQQQPAKHVTSVTSKAAEHINKTVIRKSPNDDRRYAALLLSNNLQVVLVSDPTLENSAASLAVGAGSAQDPATQLGLAHYLEHMLFLGTQKYPVPGSFTGFVQANAGGANAFTAYDKTNFMFQLNSSKFDEALDRFSDYFKAPLLDPQYADKERNAVNSEWSLGFGDDNRILYELDGITANPFNPQAQFSVGNLTTLVDKKNSVLQDEVKAFYSRYYSANNMKLTLVGKQSISELKEIAEKYFSAISNNNITRPKISIAGLTQAEMGKIIHYKSVKDLKKIFIDFPIKNNKEQWQLKPNEFVINLISSEEDGTLGFQLRKAGLVNKITAQVSPDIYGADGYLRIQADLTDLGLKNRDAVLASVFSYVMLIKKQGVNELYFSELKAMKAKDFVNASKPDPLSQAVRMSMNQFDLPIENLLDADYVYDHFDKKSIDSVLAQLNQSDARIWYISQQETADKSIPYFDGKYSIRNISAEEVALWSTLGSALTFNLPSQNTLFTDKLVDIVDNTYLRPHQIFSQKGIEVFLTHPEFYREDKGMLDIEFNVDFAQESAKNIVLSNLLSDIFKNKNTTLIDRAERASLKINIATGATNSQFVNIAGYTTKHKELLSQLLDTFASLSIADKEFVEMLDKYKQNKSNFKKSPPISQAFAHAMRMTGVTPWTDSELLAAANNVTIQDVVNYHKSVKANLLVRIFAFGNYSDESMRKMSELVVSKLPGSRMPEQRVVQKFITPEIGKKIIFNGTVEQTDNAVIDFYFDFKKSDDGKAGLVVLNSIYRNAFFSQLRTNEQLGYTVGSMPIPIDDYPGFAMYVQSSNTELVALTSRMDKFRIEFLAQLKAVDSLQIEQFKAAEVANVLQKPKDFSTEANRYSADFWAARYNFNGRERYLAALDTVNKESLIELYQKILLDKQSMNVLIQMKGTAFADKPYANP